MRKLEVICFMLLATLALAQNGGYLFINNNIYPANTVDFDTVTSDGKLRRVKTEPTGGEGFPDMPPFAGLAAAKRGKCFFAADSESSDIASFQLPSFNSEVQRWAEGCQCPPLAQRISLSSTKKSINPNPRARHASLR